MLSMICPKCGNTVSQNEVFCGQCGAPSTPQLPLPAENNFPSSTSTRGNQQLEQPGTFNAHAGMAPSLFGPPHQSPPRPQTSPLPDNSSLMQHIPPRPAHITNQPGQYTPQQQGNFYHDATEAMSPWPGVKTLGNNASPSAYAPPQPTPHGGQYSSSGYPQPPFATGQQYHPGTRIQPPPSQQKQQHNPVILIVSVCSIVVFLGAIIIGGFILTKNRDTQAHRTTPAVTATRATHTHQRRYHHQRRYRRPP
jgi:hypothetical protein